MEANIAPENLVQPRVHIKIERCPANVLRFQRALLPNDRLPQPDLNMYGNGDKSNMEPDQCFATKHDLVYL